MKTRTTLVAIIALIMASSCASRKDLVYFQDEPLTEGIANSQPQALIYKTDDLLTIDVSALDPDAVRPFNLPAVSYNADVTSAQGNLRMQTYLIDYDGNIEFPVLGTIKMGGLTRTQATAMLKERLAEYVKNPIVNIRLANFTVTIIGEVTSPGTFTIQDERITLLEALGLANDLTIFGKRNNVFLIREIEGKKYFEKIDLTSVNVVNSPLYYLQQNDVIYVEPNNAKVRQSAFNQNNAVLISAVGTLATIAAIFLAK